MYENVEMQMRMSKAVGHNVEVYLNCDSMFEGDCIIGKCSGFTSPLNNVPKVASMDIKVEGYSCVFEIEEQEIKNLIIKD